MPWTRRTQERKFPNPPCEDLLSTNTNSFIDVGHQPITNTEQIQTTFHTYNDMKSKKYISISDMSIITLAIQHYAHLYLSRGKTYHI